MTASFEGIDPFPSCDPSNRTHLLSGQPADNAKHFVSWLSAQPKDSLKGVSHAVFGCGNHDWVATFQKIPTLIDDTFTQLGSQRLIERGIGDAGASNFFESFDKWEECLWQTLQKVCIGFYRRQYI